MPLDRPRRIFRASVPGGAPSRARLGAGGLGRTALAGVVGAVLGAALVLVVAPGRLLGGMPAPAALLTAAEADVVVVDGDTLRLRQTVLRLAGVAAPLRGRVCGQADGRTLDCGTAAATALSGLIRGQPVACQMDGRDETGMPQGLCKAGATEINRSLVASGWARALHGTQVSFAAEESAARNRRLGVWRDGVASGF